MGRRWAVGATGPNRRKPNAVTFAALLSDYRKDHRRCVGLRFSFEILSELASRN
jgi:hypothetical protein